MKKILIVGLIATSSLLEASVTNCDSLLREADKYLSRVALCEATSEKHATIALAYYKRYEICINYLRTNFQINPLEDEEEPYKCENHKKKE